MVFALDPIDAEKLAQSGTPYVLAVCLLAVSAALVWVYRTYRTDVRELVDQQRKDIAQLIASHEAAMREKRQEFTRELEANANRHDEAEARWREDMKLQRAEFTAALRDQATQFAAQLAQQIAGLRK